MGILTILGLKPVPVSVAAGGNESSPFKSPTVSAAGARGAGLPGQKPPQNTPGQDIHDSILNFDREVKALQHEHALLNSKVETLKNSWYDIERQAMNGTVGTHVYATEGAKFDEGMAKLTATERELSKSAQMLAARGEALSVRLADVGADEMQIAFRTANPRDVLNIARRGIPKLPDVPGRPPGSPGFASLNMMAYIAVQLAMAYFIAQDVKYVLAADSVLEGVGRAAKAGAKYAAGAAEMALFQAVTKSTPVSAVLAVIVGMCGDQAGACEEQERAEREKEQEKALREDERQMHLAVGKLLNEQAPGSVEWLEDHWQVIDRKLWDRTIKQVQRMRVDHYVKEQMGAKIKAHELGAQDGRMSETFVRVDDMKDWDVVENAPSPDVRFLELFDEYKLGFKEGNAKRAKLIEKIRQWGFQDAKAGSKTHRDLIADMPEVAEILKDGVPPVMLLPSAYENYDDAFEAMRSAHSH